MNNIFSKSLTEAKHNTLNEAHENLHLITSKIQFNIRATTGSTTLIYLRWSCKKTLFCHNLLYLGWEGSPDYLHYLWQVRLDIFFNSDCNQANCCESCGPVSVSSSQGCQKVHHCWVQMTGNINFANKLSESITNQHYDRVTQKTKQVILNRKQLVFFHYNTLFLSYKIKK